MLHKLAARLRREGGDGEQGFTLIELMVVILIIGILIAIALPTYLGARNRANDRAAQASLRNGLASAKTCFTDRDAYVWTSPDVGSCDDARMGTIEQSLNFVDASSFSQDPNTVSVNPLSANVFLEASFSKSGTCFYIWDNQASGGAGTQYASASAPAAGCKAPATTGAITTWAASW